jgi:hypothetical protein
MWSTKQYLQAKLKIYMALVHKFNYSNVTNYVDKLIVK